MKILSLILTFVIITSHDCDNKLIIGKILFGLDLSKPNSELISQLKSDPKFIYGSKVKESNPATNTKGTYTTFKFKNHSLINKEGRIEFQAKDDLVFYFDFQDKQERTEAVAMVISELNNGCFDKEEVISGLYTYTWEKITLIIDSGTNPFLSESNYFTVTLKRK
ncbi:MAG: hypothetical protein K0R51_1408 [Cytophagaceae bacterium]|nr:hypothetical protein [Cytophagaceae bacterium]